MMTYTNETLIEGIRNNDSQTFTHLYKTYGPRILGYVLKNSGSDEDGQEVIQKTLLKVWQNIQKGSYKEESKLSQYISRVASNTWLEELRTRKRKPTVKLGKGEEMLADESDDAIINKTFRGKAIDAMYAALNKLGAACQRLIELYHFEEQALKDIAVSQDITYGSLRKRIYDCRNKLKKLAQKELEG